MIDYINTNRTNNIVTIEDPIEYLHRDKSSIINQREVGNDTESFSKALRAALRQDPDVILVGEMRDFETIQILLPPQRQDILCSAPFIRLMQWRQ